MENQDNNEKRYTAIEEYQQEQPQESKKPIAQQVTKNNEPEWGKFKHDKVLVEASDNLTIIYGILLILLAISAVAFIIAYFAQRADYGVADGSLIIGCAGCVIVFIITVALNQLVKILKGLALDVKYIRNKLYDEQTENLDKIQKNEIAAKTNNNSTAKRR